MRRARIRAQRAARSIPAGGLSLGAAVRAGRRPVRPRAFRDGKGFPERTSRRDQVMSRKVLFLVETLPSPFDRRVWQEACALRDAGYTVSIICPTGRGYERKFEAIDGIHIYRYRLPFEASGMAGYAVEYAIALAWTFVFAWRVL